MQAERRPSGDTRSRVTQRYALITPDTHVPSPLVGWRSASAVVHITPAMGAGFQQYTATLEPGGAGGPPAPGIERFLYVLSGGVTLTGTETRALTPGDYAYVPPDSAAGLESAPGATVEVFEKRYVPAIAGFPKATAGASADAPGEAFQGDPALQLQTLLPVDPGFDMAVNVFTYEPGGRLPQVEVHVMEHGLLMLEGEGVYRLGDDWFPVQAGDVIWMAAYCPQWFVAMGNTPAKYLYYKDVHRDALAATPIRAAEG
ncbi:MAG: (S)-ureidoglycine aminohydrolase [Planctomycetota bacterium]